MARPGHVDYHVHYYLDGCAHPAMTLGNIDRAAREMGLDEIAVLKHYSHAMPNGQKDWVYWHRVDEGAFETYLADMRAYQPEGGLIIHTGVETELVNENGDINIPLDQQERIESIALSVHYMPDLNRIDVPFLYHPTAQKALFLQDAEAARELKRWQEMVHDLTPAYFVEALVRGYAGAMEKYPKIHQLSHMYDGLFPLRSYQIPYQELPEKKLIEMMEPLMEAMVKHDVLWELLPEPIGNENILRRADELGVRFVASADGHCFEGSSLNFWDHNKAETLIDVLRLHKGIIHW